MSKSSEEASEADWFCLLLGWLVVIRPCSQNLSLWFQPRPKAQAVRTSLNLYSSVQVPCSCFLGIGCLWTLQSIFTLTLRGRGGEGGQKSPGYEIRYPRFNSGSAIS